MAKKATITIVVGDDTNQNEFKNWVKSCPFSSEGDQTVLWENLPETEQAAAEDAGQTAEEGEKAAA